MNRILIVSPNWLGDALLISVVPRAIKEKHKDAYVGVMAHPRVKPVFDDNPWINEVIEFDERVGQRAFSEKLAVIRRMEDSDFNTVFLIQRSFTRALICFLAGIEERIGYFRFKTLVLLTKPVRLNSKITHRQDYYLGLIRSEGIPVKHHYPEFFISKASQNKAEAVIAPLQAKYRYVVGVNPSANWLLKRWPAAHFATLCDYLIRELNCAILFIGAGNDSDAVGKVIAAMKEKPHNLCGRTNLKELGALISYMDLFISNDSGPAHMAAGLGVNTLVIFGPTSARLTAPRGKKVVVINKTIGCKIPCYKLDCKNNLCMKDITVNEVYQKAREMLSV